MCTPEGIGTIWAVDGLFRTGPKAAPNSDRGGTFLGPFIRTSFVERPFLPTITFVSTPKCGELLTGITLFSDDACLLSVLVALLLFDKSEFSVLAPALVMLLLGMVDSTPLDFAAWPSALVGELEGSFLCDGVGNRLGTVCGTAAGEPGGVEPFTPLFNKVPTFGFAESKFLAGDATPPFTTWLRVG